MEESGSGKDILCDHPHGIQHSMVDAIDGSILTKNIIKNSLTKDFLDYRNLSEAVVHNARVMGQELQVASVIDKNQGPRPHPRRPHLLTEKELNSSIIASESTRIKCSVSIALLVVLSYIDYPLLGINIVNSKSILAMRPLYMLLVTELTVLIAYLVLERRRRFGDIEEDVRVWKEGVNWERAERVLERGLVAHQTVRAIFIDFSVYGVIVVCVLSTV